MQHFRKIHCARALLSEIDSPLSLSAQPCSESLFLQLYIRAPFFEENLKEANKGVRARACEGKREVRRSALASYTHIGIYKSQRDGDKGAFSRERPQTSPLYAAPRAKRSHWGVRGDFGKRVENKLGESSYRYKVRETRKSLQATRTIRRLSHAAVGSSGKKAGESGLNRGPGAREMFPSSLGWQWLFNICACVSVWGFNAFSSGFFPAHTVYCGLTFSYAYFPGILLLCIQIFLCIVNHYWCQLSAYSRRASDIEIHKSLSCLLYFDLENVE